MQHFMLLDFFATLCTVVMAEEWLRHRDSKGAAKLALQLWAAYGGVAIMLGAFVLVIWALRSLIALFR